MTVCIDQFLRGKTLKLVDRVKGFLFTLKKNIHQRFFVDFVDPKDKKYVFIFGCQRSGTSMLLDVFRKDFNIKTYKESEELFYGSGEKHLRLLPAEQVLSIGNSLRAGVIVSKPLLDSQMADSLLSSYQKSYGLWIYRHYKDVALSNMRRFGAGNGHKDMRYIANRIKQDWRAENISKAVRSVVEELYSEELSDSDAAALFWFVRNSLFFDLALETNRSVYLCRYEDLVEEPIKVMQKIYTSVGIRGDVTSLVSDIHSESSGKGAEILLSEPIELHCRKLLERFDAYRL